MKVPPVKIYFPEDEKTFVLDCIRETMETGYLTLSKYGKEFERKFAEHLGVDFAVTVNSGTSAID